MDAIEKTEPLSVEILHPNIVYIFFWTPLLLLKFYWDNTVVLICSSFHFLWFLLCLLFYTTSLFLMLLLLLKAGVAFKVFIECLTWLRFLCYFRKWTLWERWRLPLFFLIDTFVWINFPLWFLFFLVLMKLHFG